uniref:Uncharacterized protein n=1 Tax=Glossina austeni TaxID=7395 RepID=A0A1A9V9Y7_GLOAU
MYECVIGESNIATKQEELRRRRCRSAILMETKARLTNQLMMSSNEDNSPGCSMIGDPFVITNGLQADNVELIDEWNPNDNFIYDHELDFAAMDEEILNSLNFGITENASILTDAFKDEECVSTRESSPHQMIIKEEDSGHFKDYNESQLQLQLGDELIFNDDMDQFKAGECPRTDNLRLPFHCAYEPYVKLEFHEDYNELLKETNPQFVNELVDKVESTKDPLEDAAHSNFEIKQQKTKSKRMQAKRKFNAKWRKLLSKSENLLRIIKTMKSGKENKKQTSSNYLLKEFLPQNESSEETAAALFGP